MLVIIIKTIQSNRYFLIFENLFQPYTQKVTRPVSILSHGNNLIYPFCHLSIANGCKFSLALTFNRHGRIQAKFAKVYILLFEYIFKVHIFILFERCTNTQHTHTHSERVHIQGLSPSMFTTASDGEPNWQLRILSWFPPGWQRNNYLSHKGSSFRAHFSRKLDWRRKIRHANTCVGISTSSLNTCFFLSEYIKNEVKPFQKIILVRIHW